jgi:hypothetical protein
MNLHRCLREVSRNAILDLKDEIETLSDRVVDVLKSLGFEVLERHARVQGGSDLSVLYRFKIRYAEEGQKDIDVGEMTSYVHGLLTTWFGGDDGRDPFVFREGDIWTWEGKASVNWD